MLPNVIWVPQAILAAQGHIGPVPDPALERRDDTGSAGGWGELMIARAPYTTNCESLVRMYHCIRLRLGDLHWKTLKFLGHAKAMSMVPPPL